MVEESQPRQSVHAGIFYPIWCYSSRFPPEHSAHAEQCYHRTATRKSTTFPSRLAGIQSLNIYYRQRCSVDSGLMLPFTGDHEMLFVFSDGFKCVFWHLNCKKTILFFLGDERRLMKLSSAVFCGPKTQDSSCNSGLKLQQWPTGCAFIKLPGIAENPANAFELVG